MEMFLGELSPPRDRGLRWCLWSCFFFDIGAPVVGFELKHLVTCAVADTSVADAGICVLHELREVQAFHLIHQM